MSITTIQPYGRLLDISQTHPDISLQEIAVYGYLSFMAGSTGSCYPSQRRIAEELHISREVVISTLRRLTAAGLLTVSQKHTPGQRRWSYLYTLVAPSSLQKTYGKITERMIHVCRDLSCGAIGLWFYATAAAGTGDELFFKRAELASRLYISPATLTKYIRELTAAGEAAALRETIQGAQMTRFIVRPICKIPTSIIPTQTLRYSKLVDSSSLALSLPDEIQETKINREQYLSVESCKTPGEAYAKQEGLRHELEEIYHTKDALQPSVEFEEVSDRLRRFVRNGATRADILKVVKMDLRYLMPFMSRFPRAWIADPLIRSAALEVMFGSSKAEPAKTVIQQLYWILGVAGDEQSRLLEHLDAILAGSKDGRAWLACLTGRASAAITSRPIQHPAAYIRRLIQNWLTDRHAQTVDKIAYLVDTDTVEELAPIPQTYDELVADPICDRYRAQIRKLSRFKYRTLADEYEAIVQGREAAGDPISRYDIATDDEIQDLYTLMPKSFYEVLHMIEPADAEAILALPRKEHERRATAYRMLVPRQRKAIFWDEEYTWMIEPSVSEAEAI